MPDHARRSRQDSKMHGESAQIPRQQMQQQMKQQMKQRTDNFGHLGYNLSPLGPRVFHLNACLWNSRRLERAATHKVQNFRPNFRPGFRPNSSV